MSEENPFQDVAELERREDHRRGEDVGAPRPRRNSWLWGCGCGCLVLLILVGGGCAWAVHMGMNMLRQSEPVIMALDIATTDPEFAAAVGQPIEVGWLTVGNFSIVNDEGAADLQIPVSGPAGKARLYIEAERSDGVWHLTRLRYGLGDDPQPTHDLPLVRGEPPALESDCAPVFSARRPWLPPRAP